MFTSLGGYLLERRGKIFKTAGLFGGLYLTVGYIHARLEEVKERVVSERTARDALSRRFAQTKQDVAYQIMALMPTLAEQILEGMDVETVTRELQDLSKASRIIPPPATTATDEITGPALQIPTLADNSSMGASGELIQGQTVIALSESARTESITDNTREDDEERSSYLSDSIMSGSGSASSAAPNSADPGTTNPNSEKFNLGVNPYSVTNESKSPPEHTKSGSDPSTGVGSSLLSASGVGSVDEPSRTYAEVAAAPSTSSASPVDPNTRRFEDLAASGASLKSFVTSNSGDSQSSSREALTRSKAELWREVKMLTFTRTLTTLYATALLSLFTTLQLTVLARAKYVRNIRADERAEVDAEIKEVEHERHARAMNAMLGPRGLGGDIGRSIGLAWRLGIDAVVDEYLNSYQDEMELGREALDKKTVEPELDDDAETKFLTLAWWVLNVGWKDVGERVRRGVEDVFEGVSLKTRLSAADLHRLIGDVRRRVEWEVTFEGRERRVDFLSALLPPTPEMTQHALAQGGYQPPPSASTSASNSYGYPPPTRKTRKDDVFTALVDETREIIVSPDFSTVFEAALERGVNVLCDGVVANVFEPREAQHNHLHHISVGLGEEERVRLAGMLPGLARWSKLALEGLPNELVDTITDMHEVQGLAAIVFGRFDVGYTQ